MEGMIKLTNYLMDFNKVRAFQELCGVKENTNGPVASNSSIISNEDECMQDNPISKDSVSPGFGNKSSISQAHFRHKSSANSCFEENSGTKRTTLPSEEFSKTYVITNRFLYYLFKFGSMLGHEAFYITFVPFIFWNLDPYIGRKMVVVWVVTMYIGQALKDLIQWPRPTWPPVFKLETRVEAEYGIPSTHAVAGTALPFSFLMAMNNRCDFSFEIGLFLACSWCLLVALSRLYVGMHSIMDVIAGISIAAVYLWLGWPFMDMVEEYTMTSTFAPLIIIISHFLLGVFYPSTDHYSTSRGDTVIILAAGAGIHCATWTIHQYGIAIDPADELPYSLAFPTFHNCCISLARTCIGLLILFFVRATMKALSLSLVCRAIGVSKDDPLARRRKDVEITYKFITYAVVGFFSLTLIPFLDYIHLKI